MQRVFVRIFGQHSVLLLAAILALAGCAIPQAAPQPASPSTAELPVTPTDLPQPSMGFGAISTTIHPETWLQGRSGVAIDPNVEAQVADLLSRMSLDEKVGQIIQPDANTITLDDIRKYHFGSILNGGGSGPNARDKAPPPEWLKMADAFYAASTELAVGHPAIPLIWGIDAVHGNAKIVGATVFSHNIGLGAMHDPELVRRIGAVTAAELRTIGGDWTFAPVVAVVRDDRWGRTYESYGEEPDVVSENATAIVQGLQGQPGDPDFLTGGHVLATAKHFLGDGGTENGVDQGDTIYGELALRDLFAPPYRAAIAAGVQTIMASYSSWRGQKMHGNRALLSDVLVGRLGFNGFVVGDWNGYAQLPGCSRDRCKQALLAGVDMYMAPDGWKALYQSLFAQARSGEIPMARLDEAVSRILRVKIRAGLMKEGKPSARPHAGEWSLLGSPEHRAVARQAVRESLVLLKNERQILPLSPHLHVLVAGDGADNLPKQCGGWTISWQGDGNTRADFPNGQTIFEAIRDTVQAGGGTVDLSAEGRVRERPDIAIVVFGENPYAEFQGDRANVDYQSGNRRDLKLIQSLKQQGIPVVSVFLSGRPLYVTPEIDASDAFVAAWLPGSEGTGIADMLFRKPDGAIAFDFRGTLAFSWPRGPEQTPLNADTEPYYPLFPLGYGLTYANPRDLGPLPEAPEPVSSAMEVDRYVDRGRPVQPWRFILYSNGITVPVTGASASLPGNALRVEQTAADPIAVRWGGPATLAVIGPKLNLMRQTDSDMALTLGLQVDEAPAASVTLGVGCGAQCHGSVDITQVLRAAAGTGATTIAVRLACFRGPGADMRSIEAPLQLTSRGALKLHLASVAIEPAAGAPACPAAPAS
ncbi:MAG TPA: glycoside hydrolase family 3 N-terminal domain-containing protein [Rhizomicrobium sp.]